MDSLDASYLNQCWQAGGSQDNPESTLDSALASGYYINHFIVPEIIGFIIYTIVFVPSLIISLLCLYYLFKNRRRSSLHTAVIGFSIVISSFNLAAFGLRAASLIAHVRFYLSPCNAVVLDSVATAFSLPTVDFQTDGSVDGSVAATSFKFESSTILSLTLVPIFLWLSDGFLLYRAWVIWIGHRGYTLLPGVVLLTSVATGIVWMVAFLQSRGGVATNSNISFPTDMQWLPTLGFSVGLDTLTTGMIAGRLIYHHKMKVKLGGTLASPYLPVVTIFIESAALSFISKSVQLLIPSIAISTNPIVIPLCTISSNLIILRKALGIEAFSSPSKDTQHLPTIRFQSRRPQPHLGTSWGHLETLVVRGVGGNPEVNADIGRAELGNHSEQK